MKITVIPTGNAPTHYSFSGESTTAHYDGATEDFDLSVIPADGKFTGIEPETLTLPESQIIRDAYRDEAGGLHVTLCQPVGSGHWETSAEFDSGEYDPDVIHVIYTDRPHAGTPTAITRQGETVPESHHG